MNDQSKPTADPAEHCKDCCCARSWAALGITDYTGKSIPEHIEQLREQLAAERERADKAEEMLALSSERSNPAIAIGTIQTLVDALAKVEEGK